jgi:uncharacterized SAM-binding protein YcdF (DUF218 family)
MILRVSSLLLLLYALGFVLFGVSLASPAPSNKTDAIVVLTGGPGRIERGIELMRRGQARRMLIAGTDPSVRPADLRQRLGPKAARTLRCCVDLGSESVDTRSNADEAESWLERHRYRSFRLITNDYHMRRASYLFERRFGGDYRIVYDAVPTRPRFLTLFGEYNDYLLTRLSIWLDM